MNKKFTMMLAAFMAAGYTITAEAGVVKVSKPVDGKSYYITRIVGADTLYISEKEASDNVLTVKKSLPNASFENDTQNMWEIAIDGEGQMTFKGKKTQSGGYFIGGSGFNLHQSSPASFEFKENTDGTSSFIYLSEYQLSLSEADKPVQTKDTNGSSHLTLFAPTTNLEGAKVALQVGSNYIVVVDGKVSLASSVEYIQMANKTVWTIDKNGKAKYVAPATKAGEAKEYLKIDANGASLVAETDASILGYASVGEGDELSLVATNGGTTSYVTESLKTSSNQDDAVETVETPVNPSTLVPGDFTATLFADAQEGTPENERLVVYSGSKTYWVKANNGTVELVETGTVGESTASSNFYWTMKDGVITDASSPKNTFVVDGNQKFTVVNAYNDGTQVKKAFYLYVEGKGYLKVAQEASEYVLQFTNTSSEATAFSSVKEGVNKVEDITELNKLTQGSFSLTYKIGDNEVADHKLKNITAIQVVNTTYGNGTYFVVNAPANLKVNEAITDKSVLDDLTFLAVSSSEKETGYVFTEAGAGYKLVEIAGEDLVATDTKTLNKVTYDNAKFAVWQSELNTDKLSIKLGAANIYLNDADKEELVAVSTSGLEIAAVKDGENMFVSTVATDAEVNKQSFATLSSANVVEYADFLKETAQIFNIKFVSTTANKYDDKEEDIQTYSEYNKYLGIGQVENELLAQGADLVDLSLPQNQWVVSNMTESNVVTFTNRENGQYFSAKLIKTNTDGQYRLAGFTPETNSKFCYAYVTEYGIASSEFTPSANNFVVELTAVTVGKNDGYVSEALSENDMVKIAFTSTDSKLVNELFVTVDDDQNIGLAKEGAAEFEVFKTNQKSTKSHTTSIAVLKDGKPSVSTTVKDTLDVVTYAFKYVDGDDVYFLNKNFNRVTTVANNKVEDAAQFVIKKLNNGELALVQYADDFDSTINSDTYGFDANWTLGQIDCSHNVYAAVYEPSSYISFVGQDAAISLPAKSQHVLFNNEGAYMAVNENNAAVIDGPSELKAEYTKEQLTFWLDTTDSEAIVPTFYITKGSKQFMFNATDSLSRYNEGTASAEEVKAYQMPDNKYAARAIFRAATLKDSNTLTTSIKGESKDLTAKKGIEAYQYHIVLKDKAVADEYVVRSLAEGKPYLYESNGALGFTSDAKKAVVFTIESTEAPTSNEGVSTSEVKVVAQNGSVVVKNAAGKNVVVSTILGQVVVNEVLTSDNATINVPAGIVVVAVEGESFKVNVK